MQLDGQAGAVTPQGVRAGEPAALAALCERRGGAVLAYCREVCEPAEAALAAAEALARFRAAVWASADAADLEPERLLLSATRHAASERARRPAEVGPTRRILGRNHTDTCARIPGLIVARAENLLGSADLDRLSRHLDRCSSCRATEADFRRAERAYVATAHAPLDSATTALILGALAEAAPVQYEPPPDEAEPEPDLEPEPATEPEPQPAAEPQPPPAPEPVPLVSDVAPTEPETLHDDLDDADEDGWTGEPDAVDDTYEHHMIQPGPATWNATEPPRRRRGLRVLLPLAVLVAGAIAALAVAGVFDSGSSPTKARTGTFQSTPAPSHSTASQRAARRRARQKRAAARRRQSTSPTTVTATP